MNWNMYSDVFPLRYIAESKFDERLEEFLLNKSNLNILEIGGGTESCGPLKRNCRSHDVWLLDPYVDLNKELYRGKVNWNTYKRFDLIVARNCINYLSINDIETIPYLLKFGGRFLANTFKFLHDGFKSEREETNRLGEKVLETVSVRDGVVFHTLYRPDHDPIHHCFFCYNIHQYRDVCDCAFKYYGKNSVIIECTNA